MSAVTVYTKPNCVQCKATFRALDKAGIDYTPVDITLDTDARESQCFWQQVDASSAA